MNKIYYNTICIKKITRYDEYVLKVELWLFMKWSWMAVSKQKKQSEIVYISERLNIFKKCDEWSVWQDINLTNKKCILFKKTISSKGTIGVLKNKQK